jgi:hypothetical protein
MRREIIKIRVICTIGKNNLMETKNLFFEVKSATQENLKIEISSQIGELHKNL